MEKLVQLRKAKNLTQKEMADFLLTSQQTYSRYEKGTREPDIETIIKLADYFGVSVDYLLGKPQWTEEEKALGVGNHKTVLSAEEWDALEAIEQLRQKKGDEAVKTVLQMIRIMSEK